MLQNREALHEQLVAVISAARELPAGYERELADIYLRYALPPPPPRRNIFDRLNAKWAAAGAGLALLTAGMFGTLFHGDRDYGDRFDRAGPGYFFKIAPAPGQNIKALPYSPFTDGGPNGAPAPWGVAPEKSGG